MFAGRTQNWVPESPARTQGIEIHWIIKTGEHISDGSALETHKAPLPWPRHDEMRTMGYFNFTTVTTFPCVESMTMQ